jgi:hypothetical protein
MGSKRKYTDPNAVYHLKTHIQSGKETQASIINYRKDGSPFINLVTVVPISWDTDEIAYFVGFQVDLVEQPNAILEKMRNGTYVVNYSLLPTNPAPQPELPAPASTSAGKGAAVHDDYNTPIIPEDPVFTGPKTIRMGNPLVASGAATAAAAQSSMTIAPELLEVMGAISTGDELDDDASKKRWNKMLLDHVSVIFTHGSLLHYEDFGLRLFLISFRRAISFTCCHLRDLSSMSRLALPQCSSTIHPILSERLFNQSATLRTLYLSCASSKITATLLPMSSIFSIDSGASTVQESQMCYSCR